MRVCVYDLRYISDLPWRRAQADGREDAAYFEALSAFVSKVRGEHFGWERARDMTFKDIAKNVEAYHNMLTRWGSQVLCQAPLVLRCRQARRWDVGPPSRVTGTR